MAEFGAILCSNPGCGQHDFLPYKCPACGRVFCLDHMAIGSGHDCDQGEAYLASVSAKAVPLSPRLVPVGHGPDCIARQTMNGYLKRVRACGACFRAFSAAEQLQLSFLFP